MFKILYLVKRKPGLTHEEFVHYHKTVHSQFIAAAPQAKRFIKKYLRPIQLRATPNTQEFDAILEVWFDSKEQFESMGGKLDPALVRQIMEDEKNFIDLDVGVLSFTYEEGETEP